MGVRALIMINSSGVVDVGRQMEACWEHLQTAPHLTFGGLLRAGSTALSAADAVRNGQADVIVAAYRDPKLELTGEIEAAGGRVEYAQPTGQGRLSVRGIIASLHRRLGWSATTIARAIGAPPRDVSDHLRRAGIRTPRDK